MEVSTPIEQFESFSVKRKAVPVFLRFFLFGLLLPLSFAPFHLPGMAILSLGLFYYQLSVSPKSPFLHGLMYGFGFFGLGVSWIFVSIHEYGHLNDLLSAFITCLFIVYLSLFPALMAYLFSRLKIQPFTLLSALAFSALWILSEYLRATFLTGFPWLLLGFGQFDAPIKSLLPVIGVYGTGLLTCFGAALLSLSVRAQGGKRLKHLAVFTLIMLIPFAFKHRQWSESHASPVSVGVIQANLSMRDKWDEALFWQLLQGYQEETEKLLGTQLILMPESAIPLPPSYVSDFLYQLQQRAKRAGSAILLGIPQPVSPGDERYFNSLMTLGKAKGSYQKQHLVPFGEYMPRFFIALSDWLGIPDANLQAGKKDQTLVRVQKHAIASLICYELAYGDLLRRQLPAAEWIVSISDDGWFGRSLAMYQQQQMAQVRSLQVSRYQVVANNDGLSSVINHQGDIVASLPAFSSGLLRASLYPMTGSTPWIHWGDMPILLFCALTYLFCLAQKQLKNKDSAEAIAGEVKRRYPYQPV
ncbi:apolipoprotein N-acyltransferase [Legionella erythra]|uniref:Apolipoprotein N-acyltransferase n=1 Tax=Legionella erythra TaxID=448 RepID=A0A0W0TRT4_LEGER|nr:apolipoprotein N-acyltransferase [Legionella erythra]KTC98085.1 apolipoprotein N-acyltransferase [Legionella erythra]